MGWGLKKGREQGEGVISFACKMFIPVVIATGAYRGLNRFQGFVRRERLSVCVGWRE